MKPRKLLFLSALAVPLVSFATTAYANTNLHYAGTFESPHTSYESTYKPFTLRYTVELDGVSVTQATCDGARIVPSTYGQIGIEGDGYVHIYGEVPIDGIGDVAVRATVDDSEWTAQSDEYHVNQPLEWSVGYSYHRDGGVYFSNSTDKPMSQTHTMLWTDDDKTADPSIVTFNNGASDPEVELRLPYKGPEYKTDEITVTLSNGHEFRGGVMLHLEVASEVVVDANASKKGGESGAWVIPAAIVGVGAAALVLHRRKRGDDSPGDDGEPPSTFRMQLYKEFGDTLFVGGGAQMVGARIEEVRADGTTLDRPDLTARISFGVSDALDAENLGRQGRYQCVNVRAVSAGSPHAVVAITFAGAGGTFTSNVRFNVSELGIDFPDVPLTFVAGAGQTFEMPFRFNAPDAARDANPRFEARFSNPDASRSFAHARVLPDPDYPDRLFAVHITECGKADDHEPGTMQTFTCEVTATLTSASAGAPDVVLEGSFHFFRFYEGLRFTVEPLKCYYVRHGEKEEELVYANEALKMAVNAQAQATGLAGGSIGSSLGAASSLRWQARDVKRRFPEVFCTDDVYVFDKRDKVMFTPGRTHAYATLFVVDEFLDEQSRPYLRPTTPLPKKDDMQLAFADVEGTSVLRDKDGNEIARPVEVLDFRYFIKDVQGMDNTVVFEILPTAGVMLPPNRSLVDVTAVARWTNRAGQTRVFTAKERVNAISQPYRVDFEEKCDDYIAADDEIRRMLRGIQTRIQGCYTGKLAAKGTISVSQTAADVFAGLGDAVTEHPLLALNPITAPGIALYQLYISARDLSKSIESQSKNVYFDDLMPIYHYIEMMLEGHEYEFGFFDYDVRRIVVTFARFETGEVGAAEAIDLAYHGHDMMFADALSMTVQDWNHSWTAIGVRIGFALVTGGQSESLFIPLAAIGAGMEASMDYIDRGGDKLLEAYRVGISAAAKHAIVEKVIMGTVSIALDCAKWAVVLTRECLTQRQLFAKALKEMFSTATYGQKVARVATGLERQLARVGARADASIHAYRAAARAGVAVERDIAYTLGRIEGTYKLDMLRELAAGGGKQLSAYQQRAVIVTIQSDKHAMRALIEATGPEAKAMQDFFSNAIREIEKDVLLQARGNLSKQLRIPMTKLRVRGTSGNVGKVSMDLDATFQYFDDAAREWKDVDAALGQKAFDAEFYKVVRGYAAESDEVAKMLAHNADMTITDLLHPEAYSRDYRDALRVIDANLAGEPFTFGAKVAGVARYKCQHWLEMGRRAMADAKAASAVGNMREARRLAAAAESYVEESARQFTKQADRIIINKLAAMQSRGIKVPTGTNIDLFLEKVAVLKRSGMGRFGGTGLSSAEVEEVLRRGYETTFDVLYADLEALTVELDNAIKAASKT